MRARLDRFGPSCLFNLLSANAVMAYARLHHDPHFKSVSTLGARLIVTPGHTLPMR